MPITSRCHRWRKSFSFRPRKDTAVAPGISSAFEWLANLPPHRIADRRAAVCQSVKCHEGNAQLGLWIYGISTAHLHLLHAIFIIYARPVGGGVSSKWRKRQPIGGLTWRVFHWCLSQSALLAIPLARHFRFLYAAKVFPLLVKYFIAVAHIFAGVLHFLYSFGGDVIYKRSPGGRGRDELPVCFRKV